MIEVDESNNKPRDLWLDTESFAISIQESECGTIRIEVCKGTHLGESLAICQVRPGPEPKAASLELVNGKPPKTEQLLILEALGLAGYKDREIALMIGVTIDALRFWRMGRNISNANIERLRTIAEALKVEVPEC